MKDAMQNRKNESVYSLAMRALPYLIIANLTMFGIICVSLLLLEKFQTGLIWGLGIVSAVIVTPLVFRAVKAVRAQHHSKYDALMDTLVVVGVVLWGGFNVFYTAEHVITNRDPGVYATAASWLSTHESLRIEDKAIISPETPGLSTGSMGYWSYQASGGQIYAQGQHLLPALLGAIGKFVGPVDALHFSIGLGMTALLGLYAFLRLVVRSHWALIATSAMAASLPLIHFSRDTYTEPLALTLTFGGLAFLWLAQQSRRSVFWALSGLALGSAALVRIDGYLALVGIAAFIGVYAIASSRRKEASSYKRELTIFITAIAAPGFLGWLDLVILSPHYYHDVTHLMTQEAAAIGGVLATAGVIGLFARKKKKTFDNYLHKLIPLGRNALPVLILLLMALLSSRFLWMQGQNPTSPLFEGRSYSEVTTFWNEWYIGSALMLMGIIGMAIVAYRVFSTKQLSLLLPVFLVVAGTAMVYFLKPSIFPDQPWAARRMLPVVMPGLLACAAIALEALESHIHLYRGTVARKLAIGALGLLLIVTPLQTSAPFLRVADSAQYAYIEGVCGSLEKNNAVVWVGHGAINALQATRTYCGLEAYGFTSMPSEAVMKSAARDAGLKDVELVIAINTDEVESMTEGTQKTAFTSVSQVSYNRITALMNGAPRSNNTIYSGVSLARVSRGGELVKM